jgi:D-tyrosyl-tRNA(Tyr) deacylase
MRVVVQRVKKASVVEKGKVKASIKRGLLVYLAIAEYDTSEDVRVLVDKIIKLRIFAQKGKAHDFQKSILDIKGEILVIPNYTLYADLSEGNRPYFGEAARPDKAIALYKEFLKDLKKVAGEKIKVKSGTFGEFMDVHAVNDGPATIILETAILEEEGEGGNGREGVEPSESFDDLLGKLGVDINI